MIQSQQIKSIVLGFLLMSFNSFSQTSGNSVFGTDQIVEVRITFNQPNYWDSLVANYSTETDMIAASVEFTDLDGIHHLDSVNIRLKGNSSYSHPGNKKSFKMDFNDYVSGQKYDGLKKLNFNNGYKDPTFLREKIFMDLCHEIGVPAPRINFCNVYMNNTFWGFYTMVEQVDKEFIQNNFDDDNGNLFKAGDAFTNTSIVANLKYIDGQQSSYQDWRYELKTNETENNWTDLVQFVDFINNSSTANFQSNLNTNVNLPRLYKSIATDVLFSNLDSYQNSARNYYIYHDSLADKWEWIKWDANESFGSYSGGPGGGSMLTLAPNYIATDRPLVQNIFNNASLYSEYKAELCNILANYFTNAHLDPKIDALKNLIQSSVFADNNKQYTNANFTTNITSDITSGGGPGGGGTTYGLKSFITARYNYMSAQISCYAGVNEESVNSLEIYPNPFSEVIYIKGLTNEDTINVYDLKGNKIDFNFNFSTSESTIKLNAGAGVYLLKRTNSNYTESIRIIKN